MGGSEFLARMIDVFLEDAPGRVREAVTAGDARELGALGRAGHALVASAGRLGAAELSSVARRIEEAARDGRGEEAFGLVGRLTEEFDSACRLLRTLRSEIPS